jgi:hypothetical protein
MSAQPASTITVHLTPRQRAAYLTDWDHHSDTDDTDHAALYTLIASAKLSTITDAEGKRRRRHVLTLTRAQACDILTNIAYAMEMNTRDADDGDTDAANRIKHHGAAYTVVRAAGAETITEFNARTGVGETPADQELPAVGGGGDDREDPGTRDVIRQPEAPIVADQEEAHANEGDGLTCPNGNRPPECTEIDPCEACAQDADAEAEEIEVSMGLRAPTGDRHRPDPRDVYEVTVLRSEMITFTLPAASAQDAEERYLMDGEETGSITVELRVDSTKRQDPEPLPPT